MNILATFQSIAMETIVILWIISVMRTVFFWLNFIQIKQYRIDRILVTIKSKKFNSLFFSSYRIGLIAILLLWEIIYRTSLAQQLWSLDLVMIIITLWLLINTILTFKGLLNKSLQLPIFTFKISILLILALAINLLLAWIYIFWPEQLLILEIIQPILVLILFILVYSPNLILHKLYKIQARKKRLVNPNLKVIGITGSYGKTSMKEYLNSILSIRYKVLSTPAHLNVDTGIAKFILAKLEPTHEILIVEMGAYKRGEIKSICDIVAPNYAVLTGLSNQHIELFGSQENINKAKFELVDAVKDPTKIFANIHSDLLKQKFKSRNIQPIWYGDAYTDLLPNTTNNESVSINLSGAITIAKALFISLEEIKDTIKHIPSIPKIMEYKKGLNDSVFIDDSYNANTLGVLSSLNDLKKDKHKTKIFVFQDIIELGVEGESDHRKIAKKIAETTTHVLLIPSPHMVIIKQTLIDAHFPQNNIFSVNDLDRLRQIIDDQTIVLFEGRGSETILNRLQQQL